jgi:uncharacterized delta-60 repeat protein
MQNLWMALRGTSAVVFTAALFFTGTGAAVPGEPDLSFGTDGFVRTEFGLGSDDWATKIELLKDGRMLVIGSSVQEEGSPSDIALARYLADGSLDPSFGVGGLAKIDLGPSGDDQAMSGLLQPDGRIVIAGVSNAAGQQDFVLVRRRSDGTPDPSFGSGGHVLTDVSATRDDLDWGNAVARQPDGKLVVVGQTTRRRAGRVLALARYTPRGTLDRSFGDRGKVITNLKRSPDEWAAAVAIQPDGKLVVGGGSLEGDAEWVLARYQRDGRLDPSFGNTGSTLTKPGLLGTGEIRALLLTSGGKIVAVGGGSGRGSSYRIAIVRYRPDGRVDPTFGRRGRVVTPVDSSFSANAFDAARQRDGKIVVAGASRGRILVARYLRNGSLDPTFGKAGVAIRQPPESRSEYASGVALQGDGRIVVAGGSAPLDSEGFPGASDFALARFAGS